jgi:hypothetical protein
MRIDKIDKIVLTYEEYQEISMWVQAQNFDSVDITLNECLIVMKDIEYKGFANQMGIYFRIDQHTGDILVQQYDMNDMKVLISGMLDEEFFRNGKIRIDVKEERWKKFLKQEYLEQNIKITILTVLNIFQYMNHCRENVVIEEHTKRVRKASRHKAKKKNKPNFVPLKTKQYSFRNTKTTKTEYKYNRHKEVWSVRGHWRHYKDGRRVWIKPHNRGLGEIQEGKVYKAT